MGVDVIDVTWFETGSLQGRRHGLEGAAAARLRSGQMEGVASVARPGQLARDAQRATLGRLRAQMGEEGMGAEDIAALNRIATETASS